MKQLLRQYIVLGIAVQFVLACFLDFSAFLFAGFYRDIMELPELPEATAFVISVRHWAFAWPVIVLLSTVAIFRKAHADETFLHIFGAMMLVPVPVMIITLWILSQPLFIIDYRLGR
jgi:hypothetical protein